MEDYRTQKEIIDKGRKQFNDTIVKYSISDNIYEAILEWNVVYKVDLYTEDEYIENKFVKDVKRNLINGGYENIANEIQITFHYGERGSCICGQKNLRYVYYIKNTNTLKILNVGSDCVKKTFPDGSVTDEISIINSAIKKSARDYKSEINKLKKQVNILKNRIVEITSEKMSLLEEFENFDAKINENVKNKTIEIQTTLDNVIKENIKLKNEIEQWHYCYNFYLNAKNSKEDEFFRACDNVKA